MKWLKLWKTIFEASREAPNSGLIYTWNGLNPEIIRKNWRSGDEYWVLVWWKNFNTQNVYYLTEEKGKTMNVENNTTPAAEANAVAAAPKLTDAELEKLLASKPVDATFYVDEVETSDEPTRH
jgi:hypothetical protein